MPRSRRPGKEHAAPNREKLDDQFLRTVPTPSRRTLYWDTKQAGLVLIVHPTGTKSFYLYYRRHGRPRWYHIANAGRIGSTEAREEARRLNARMVLDPQLDVQAEKVAARKVGTFDELATRYLEEYAKPKLRSWRQSEYKINTYLLPRWRHLQAGSISRRDVRSMFDAVSRRGSPMAANQALAQAGAVFSWAIKNEVVDLTANPCRGIERNTARDRERVLSDDEVPAFWNGFENAGLVKCSALRILLLTGQRPGEVCHMRWQDLNVGEHRLVDNSGQTHRMTGAWWKLPGEPDGDWPGTKNKQTHRVWLTEAALTILDEVAENREGPVFRSPRGGPIGQLHAAMADVCKSLGIDKADKVTPHDLRRTHGTTVTALGFARDQMNRVQNHREGGIADVYDRHGYAYEACQIQEAVGGWLMALVEGQDDEKVVTFHG